jgi:type IV pilus assembly protein PilA
MLRERRSEERGFTMIELLVVVMLIAILAAIAIPSFINQSAKASDAGAKELVHGAQVAIESCATDNDGAYNVAACDSPAALQSREPTITISAGAGTAYLSSVQTPSGGGYTLTTVATDGDSYSLSRSPSGATSRFCSNAPGQSACPASQSW